MKYTKRMEEEIGKRKTRHFPIYMQYLFRRHRSNGLKCLSINNADLSILGGNYVCLGVHKIGPQIHLSDCPVTGELLTEIYPPDVLCPGPLPAQLSKMQGRKKKLTLASLT